MPTKKKKKNKFSLDKINDGNKEILFDILEAKGVESVTVTFDGGGDSGQIEDSDIPDEVAGILVEGAKISNGRVWSPACGFTESYKNDPTVKEMVESFCYHALESLYGGWENNDGAFGEFRFLVKERVVAFDFNQRYTESELHEHEL